MAPSLPSPFLTSCGEDITESRVARPHLLILGTIQTSLVPGEEGLGQAIGSRPRGQTVCGPPGPVEGDGPAGCFNSVQIFWPHTRRSEAFNAPRPRRLPPLRTAITRLQPFLTGTKYRMTPKEPLCSSCPISICPSFMGRTVTASIMGLALFRRPGTNKGTTPSQSGELDGLAKWLPEVRNAWGAGGYAYSWAPPKPTALPSGTGAPGMCM